MNRFSGDVPQPEHFGGVTGGATIETDSLLRAEFTLDSLIESSLMGAFIGNAGYGKTFALRTILRGREDVRTLWVEFESRPTLLHLARTIYFAMFGKEAKGRRNEISSAIIEGLRGSVSEKPILLVVDEAQRLNKECIEYLRYLHDHVVTGFAMVLAGGDSCWDKITSDPMLRSRIARVVSFGPLTKVAVLKTMPKYHKIYKNCDPVLIGNINRIYAKGKFRNWANFTGAAVKWMKRKKLEKLDEENALIVIKLLNGGQVG